MSLESISALRQLTQVREQAATNQNDNLEKVQGSVQQSSVAEAQRTDGLFLEKAKAQYEVALNQATVERIQSQLARERTSLAVTAMITVATVGLAGVDAYMNLKKDFSGGQKLGGNTSGAGVDGISETDGKVLARGKDLYTVSGSGTKTTETFDKGALNPDIALKYGLITKDENGNFKETNKGKFYGVSVNKDDNSINYDPSKRADGKNDPSLQLTSETVYRTTLGEKGEGVQYSQGATITQDDIRLKAEQSGLIDGTGAITDKGRSSGFDPSNMSFESLMKADPKAAEALFNENAVGLANKGSQINAFYSLQNGLKAGLTDEVKPGGSTVGVDKRSSEILNSLADNFEKNDRSTEISGKDGAKYIFNALVTFAQTVVPQFQALMAAKDKVEKTEIELQAAIEKLAAARKKLSQIENIIESVGGDALGNANNQAEGGLS